MDRHAAARHFLAQNGLEVRGDQRQRPGGEYSVAMLLEIALGAKLSEIYVEQYMRLHALVLARAAHLPPLLRRQIRSRLEGKDTT